MDYTDFLPVLNDKEIEYLELVQNKIHYCVYCQPYDGGTYVWVLGEQTNLDDIFVDFDVPEESRDKIAKHLKCPNCGREYFERFDEVGLIDIFDRKTQELIDKGEEEYGDRIDNFINHLELYPTLALINELANEIYKDINSGNINITNVEGEVFRARLVEDCTVYDSKDLFCPSIGVSKGGRYNHPGQKVLYIATNEETAIKEVLTNNIKSLVWIQKYRLERVENILDLRSTWDKIGESKSVLFAAILNKRILYLSSEDQNSNWQPQYFITQFIADCSKCSNFQGIIYNSTKSYGDNIVLFNPDLIKIHPLENPKIFIHNKD